MLLMPADHLIDDVAAFQATVQGAAAAARRGFLTLFGIRPDSPATGYGYIRQGDAIPDAGKARRVAAFVEKPDRAKAETYLRSGDYFWNSGIVLARASVLLAELENLQLEIVALAREAVERGERDADFLRLDGGAYRRSRAISFDHAVLEKSDRVAVVPAAFGWRDVGSWSSLLEAADRDAAGNAAIGNVILEATKDSYVRSEGPLVATLGVEGLIVVATKAAILVAGKDHDQDIRTLVERLGKKDVDPA